MTYSVDLEDLVAEKKRNIKKNRVEELVEGLSKKKNATVVKNEDEVDHIINEHRRIASVTRASDHIARVSTRLAGRKFRWPMIQELVTMSSMRRSCCLITGSTRRKPQPAA